MLLWQKMTMLYLALAIGCAFWQPAYVFQDYPTALNLFDIDSSNYNNLTTLNYGTSTGNSITQATEQGNIDSSGTSSPFLLIDALFSIMSFIDVLFAVIFSPFYLLSAGLFPTVLIYIVGIPMVAMLLIGLIGFIRGTG